MNAYVGCRTTKERNASGKGIRVYEVSGDGSWDLRQTLETFPNPSYLCLDKEKQFLYSVHGDYSEISAFSIAADGSLSYLNTVSTYGVNPVHLSIHRSNRFIYVANLQSGNISVLERNPDGRLGRVTQYVALQGRSVATSSHPHQVNHDEKGEFLIVSAQGRLQGRGGVTVFSIGDDGHLFKEQHVLSREKAEPRHTAFHPNNRYCYGVNEIDCTVTVYDFQAGHLAPKQIISILRDSYTGDGWASGIVVEPKGRSLYVSDRKQNSISCLSIDQETGRLRFVDDTQTEGLQPRFICLDHLGTGIVAANEMSDTIKFYNIDLGSGRLVYSGQTINTETPVCVVYR